MHCCESEQAYVLTKICILMCINLSHSHLISKEQKLSGEGYENPSLLPWEVCVFEKVAHFPKLYLLKVLSCRKHNRTPLMQEAIHLKWR